MDSSHSHAKLYGLFVWNCIVRSLINEFIKFTHCKGIEKKALKATFVFAWTLYVSTHLFGFTIKSKKKKENYNIPCHD